MVENIGVFADEQTACGESPMWDMNAKRLLWKKIIVIGYCQLDHFKGGQF